MDKRKYNGAKTGENRGQGRKPKASEIELIELLSPLDAKAFEALEKGVKSGEFNYIKLFFEYRFSKPKQQIEINTQSEPIIIDWTNEFHTDKKTTGGK